MTDITKNDVEPDEELVARLAALLNLTPGWQRNETATIEAAAAMVRWADRLSWAITIEEVR